MSAHFAMQQLSYFNYFSFLFGFSSLAALLPSIVAAISALCAKPV
jgi:hypothetical protein